MTSDTMRDAVRSRYATARIDGLAFNQKIARCDLATCKGMCCYDGVHVDAETERFLAAIAEQRKSDFPGLGLDLPNQVIVDADWPGPGLQRKTATRPFPFRRSVRDYPAHFADTSCVFRLDDGRCGLQTLAQADGRHAWSYKPSSCWLHPIVLDNDRITLFSAETDRNNIGDYRGYGSRTFCGRTVAQGIPAFEALSAELNWLGGIIGRDLIGEIRAQLVEAQA